MLTDANRKISIIAYYFSKFDKDAINALGYNTYSEAFEGVSLRFGKTNNYMKLRRDEFDALVSTKRQGWNKRAPAPSVLLMHNDLKNFSFDELTGIVKNLIADDDAQQIVVQYTASEKKIITELDETDYELVINAQDTTASLKKKITSQNVRVYDRKIPDGLKKLYNYRCQICGATATVLYSVDVSEAHHIDYFVKSMNNNPSNIVILCPDHHRIVHKAKALFNYELHQFEYENAKVDQLMLNLHL